MTGFNKVLPDKEGGNFLFFTVYWVVISRRKFPKRKIWCGYVAGLLLLWFMQPKHTGLSFCSTFPETK
jgi:hypothetical protein